ncbi:AIPR family protein [Prevotella sp. RM4]|uniref:AIPR family protein n=1 Tax=Prevotella sp. RM4 TaxID=1200547 RepID=UPI00051B709C|nr:AIPR family protein [Prevotella sp. RM4]
MDIKEFAQELIDNVNMSVEMTGSDYDQELATSILEYMEDNGEVNAPEICSFQKTRSRITAYDYNDEAESLDLFYLMKANTLLGKVNNGDVQKGFNYLMSFYREAMNGQLFKNEDVTSSDEIVEVAKLVQSTKGQINQLRIYVITDGLTDPSAVPAAVESEDGDYVIEYNVWDMQRVYQQHNIRAGKEKVEIDFPTTYNTELQCLKMSEQNLFVDAYLAIIPGITLAKIYKQYQQVLLEKNVRTFLQFKGKVNKEIRKTLRENPDMFFSYNNGISTTASEIETKEIDGMLYITRLYDWQIVNGGQTTASIAASLTDKEVDLNKVFVPMKISVIRDAEHDDELIRSISISANSQTAIKNSDFSANDPYLVDLERFSRSEWVPNGNNKPFCKWYFERTRGQYLDQLAQLSGVNEKTFKIEYPKKQKITKTDIAKYEAAWKQRPYDVCWGAEKNYKSFVAEIKREKPTISAAYFKKIIAKGILFNAIDALVKAQNLGGYKANMNAYLMSSISFLSGGNLDLTYIWDNQKVQEEVLNKVDSLIPLVWEHITGGASGGNQSSNVGEWTKKSDCWNKLKLKLGEIEKFDDELMQPDTNDDGSYLNETQQNRIKEAEAIEPNYWFELANWAKRNNQLTPIERKAAFNFGTMKSRNRGITSLKQALFALKIVEKAKEQGFEG